MDAPGVDRPMRLGGGVKYRKELQHEQPVKALIPAAQSE